MITSNLTPHPTQSHTPVFCQSLHVSLSRQSSVSDHVKSHPSQSSVSHHVKHPTQSHTPVFCQSLHVSHRRYCFLCFLDGCRPVADLFHSFLPSETQALLHSLFLRRAADRLPSSPSAFTTIGPCAPEMVSEGRALPRKPLFFLVPLVSKAFAMKMCLFHWFCGGLHLAADGVRTFSIGFTTIRNTGATAFFVSQRAADRSPSSSILFYPQKHRRYCILCFFEGLPTGCRALPALLLLSDLAPPRWSARGGRFLGNLYFFLFLWFLKHLL